MCGAAVEQIMSTGNETELAIQGIEPSTIVSTLTFMNGVMFVGRQKQIHDLILADFCTFPSSIFDYSLFKTANLWIFNSRRVALNNDSNRKCRWYKTNKNKS